MPPRKKPFLGVDLHNYACKIKGLKFHVCAVPMCISYLGGSEGSGGALGDRPPGSRVVVGCRALWSEPSSSGSPSSAFLPFPYPPLLCIIIINGKTSILTTIDKMQTTHLLISSLVTN